MTSLPERSPAVTMVSLTPHQGTASTMTSPVLGGLLVGATSASHLAYTEALGLVARAHEHAVPFG
jgi:hypothetical protein